MGIRGAHADGPHRRDTIGFTRACWHTVDPGTVLFTGSLDHNIACSGTWLAEHEYVLDDVNRWWFLARSGRAAAADGLATHHDLTRSARHRSREGYGTGDELRAVFVADGTYWGAAGFLRDDGDPWFTEDDVRLVASVCARIADGYRRAILIASAASNALVDHGPGVVVFDERGDVESISPAAERWIDEIVERPPPATPVESKPVQLVAARARALGRGDDPLRFSARSRILTRGGVWLLLHGTPLTGGSPGWTAVVIQPAPTNEVAPIVAFAYGLTDRERQITRLAMAGQSTKQMAAALAMSPYTVQDHLKSIFDKTGARTRGELVGQVFLEHYVPRWAEIPNAPDGWTAVHDDAARTERSGDGASSPRSPST